MSEWKDCKLEDFAIINPSESLRKGTGAKKVAMEAIQPFTKRIPFYSWEDYGGGVKFRNGDTLMARITPSLENGKTSFVDILEDHEVGFGSTEFLVFREREGVSNKHYLYYLATSPEIRNVAIKSMTGSSGRQRVQTDVVKDYIVSVPPLPEQKAIASVLSSLDDKIDLLHRQNRTLEQMAETLFRQWFVEEAEEKWDDGILTDLADHLKDSINPGNNPDEAYNHYSIPSFDSGKEPVKEIGSSIRSNKYLVYPESILFSKLNPHKDKRVWLISDRVAANSICSTEFQVIKPKSNDFLFFIYGWLTLNENYREISSGVGGTSGSHQRISPEAIFSFRIPLVSKQIVAHHSNTVRPMFQRIWNNQSQIQTLTRLRDSLLPKLMSGEVRVKTD